MELAEARQRKAKRPGEQRDPKLFGRHNALGRDAKQQGRHLWHQVSNHNQVDDTRGGAADADKKVSDDCQMRMYAHCQVGKRGLVRWRVTSGAEQTQHSNARANTAGRQQQHAEQPARLGECKRQSQNAGAHHGLGQIHPSGRADGKPRRRFCVSGTCNGVTARAIVEMRSIDPILEQRRLEQGRHAARLELERSVDGGCQVWWRFQVVGAQCSVRHVDSLAATEKKLDGFEPSTSSASLDISPPLLMTFSSAETAAAVQL